MNPISKTVRTLQACALLLSATLVYGAGFADPLDTPAMPSTLAAHVLINGMTHAGTRLVAVGMRGHIVYSDDRGQSWIQARVPVSSDLVAVYFPSPSQGWAVGHDGIVLHSADGGVSWTRQLDGRSAAALLAQPGAGAADVLPDKPFLDVWFENEQRGFIVGAFNFIFRTEDGGKTWQPWQQRIDNPKGFHLNAISKVGSELFIVGEQGLILKLAADGSRFQAVSAPYKGSFFGVTGKAGVVLVYGLRGNAFRSADAGVNWEKVETGVQTGLTAGTVLDDGSVVLVSQAGQVLRSRDDGRSFLPLKQAKPGSASTAVAVNRDTLVIGGARGIRAQALTPL